MESLTFIRDDEDQSDAGGSITQYKGSELEVWKTRGDGFHFVYCNRMEVGYWVTPTLIDVE